MQQLTLRPRKLGKPEPQRPPSPPRPTEEAYWDALDQGGAEAFGVLQIEEGGTPGRPTAQCVAWGLSSSAQANALAAFANWWETSETAAAGDDDDDDDDADNVPALTYLACPRTPITFERRHGRGGQYSVLSDHIPLTNHARWQEELGLHVTEALVNRDAERQSVKEKEWRPIIKSFVSDALKERPVRAQQKATKALFEHCLALVKRGPKEKISDPRDHVSLWKEKVYPKLREGIEAEFVARQQRLWYKKTLDALLAHLRRVAPTLPSDFVVPVDGKTVYPPGIEPPSCEEANEVEGYGEEDRMDVVPLPSSDGEGEGAEGEGEEDAEMFTD